MDNKAFVASKEDILQYPTSELHIFDKEIREKEKTELNSHGSVKSDQIKQLGAKSSIREDSSNLSDEKCKNKENAEKRIKGRRFIIEPVLALYVGTYSVLAPLTSQFILAEMMELYNATGGGDNSSTNACSGGAGSNVGNDTNDPYKKRRQDAQAASALLTLIYNLSQGIPALVMTLYLGPYSDRNGRRLALILPTCGIIVRCLSFALQKIFNLPFWVSVAGTVINGLSGSNSVLITACYAYISDTVSKDKRSSHIMIAECIMNSLQCILQLSMGFVISALGFFWPFIILVCLSLINFIYVLFFVPEPLSNKSLDKGQVSLCLILDSFKTVVRKRPAPHTRCMIIICLAAYAFNGLGFSSQFGLEELYLLTAPICMDSILLGFWKTARLLLQSATLMLFGRLFSKHLDDVYISILSSVSLIVYFITFPFVTNIWSAFVVLIPAFASIMGSPVGRSIVAKMVSPTEQGGMMSVLLVIDKVGQLAGNALFNNIYASTLNTFRPLTYLCLAACSSLGLAFMVIYKCVSRREKRVVDTEVISMRF